MQQYRKSTHSLYSQELQQAALLWVNHALFIEIKAAEKTQLSAGQENNNEITTVKSGFAHD